MTDPLDKPGTVLPFQIPVPANPDPVLVLDRNKYTPILDLSVRRSYTCLHDGVREIDEQGRKIVCLKCKAELDPYKCLQDIGIEWENRNLIWKRLCDDITAAQARLESLKRQEANARARLRRLEEKASWPPTGAEFVEAAQAAIEPRSDEEIEAFIEELETR